MNFIPLYLLFFGLFISFCLIMIAFVFLNIFSINFDYSNFIMPAAISFIGFMIIGIISSFKLVRKGVLILIYIGLVILGCCGLSNLPLGPIDLKLLFESKFDIKLITIASALAMSSAYSGTIVYFQIVHNIFKKPGRELLIAKIYRDMIIKLFRFPKRVVEYIYRTLGIDLLVLIGLRFYILGFINDTIVNVIFVVLEGFGAILRIIVAKGNIQLVILSKSLKEMYDFDKERSTKSAKKAQKILQTLYENIPQMVISYLLPSFVTLSMCLLFGASFLIDGKWKPIMNILSLYIIALSQFCLIFTQFVPESAEII